MTRPIIDRTLIVSRLLRLKMWVELSNDEIDLVIDALGEGPLADRLRVRPHRQTGAFTKAAEEKLLARTSWS